MKILVVVLIILLVMSCSDSEPPTRVIDPPEPVAKPQLEELETAQPERVPPERTQYEIPEGIPQGLAEHFIDLQEHMTEFEWHLFLREMKKTCDGRTSRSYFQAYLNDDLSEKALNAIKQLDKEGRLLPSELSTKRGRIRAAGLAMPEVRNVEFVINGTKVFYQKNDYTSVIELFGRVFRDGNVGWGAAGGGTLDATDEFNFLEDARISFIVERIHEEWGNQWFEEFFPRAQAGEFAEEPHRVRGVPTEVELARVKDFIENKFRPPHIPNDLDLLIIYLDEAGNLLSPKEAADLIVDYDDAPQATAEQLEAYNHIHSPDAYDCVE